MRRRLVVSFLGVTVIVLAVAWTSVLLSDRTTESVLPEILLGLLSLAVAAATGVLVADHLSRPFRELSAVAVQIGEGRFDAQIPRYPIPEADELGRSLHEAAARLDELVRREQAVAVKASHELRTPITALRLSLEDLTLWKGTPGDVVTELHRSIAELDRLSHAVTELLDHNGANRETTAVDLAQLAEEAVQRWRRAPPAGHQIELDAPGPMLVRAPLALLEQVLDTMLAHTTARSRDGVSVDVVRLGGTVRVRVSHEGPRVLPTGVIHATTPNDGTDGDPALAEAGALAEAMSGYLGVEDSTGTCLVLLVPSADAHDS